MSPTFLAPGPEAEREQGKWGRSCGRGALEVKLAGLAGQCSSHLWDKCPSD